MESPQAGRQKITPALEWGLLLTIGVAVLFLYTPSMNGPFVLDDLRLIPNNKQIQSADLSLDSFLEITSSPRPVAMLSFAANYYIHGTKVIGYHLTNVLIHVIAGWFLYFFLKSTLALPSIRSCTQSPLIPLVVTAIWLANPLQTQSISYIVQRMNSMSAMFFILSMLFYVKARTTASSHTRWGCISGTVLSMILALGSKENTATLPFFIFLYEWFFFQDLRWDWARRYIFGLFVLVLLFSGFLYINPQFIPKGLIKQGYSLYTFTMLERVLTEPRVLFLYLSLLVFPHPSRLNLDYNFPISTSLTEPVTTLVAILALVSLFLAALFLARKERLLSFCILWFLGNLVIESSIIPLDLVFEHRMYLPSMLTILLIIIISDRLLKNKKFQTILVIGVLSLFSMWTYQRNVVWGDALALYLDSAKKAPQDLRPAYNVACEYAKRGDVEKSMAWLTKSVTHKDFRHWILLIKDPDLNSLRTTSEFQALLNSYLPEELKKKNRKKK